ncbi:MAG: tetratricopeptide repeat protein, partial [Flavobacterium sp.]|nr:tetratricopeptide repeat protein [Flavobacterium sp.]
VLYLYAICLIETDNFTKAEDILLSLKNGTSIYNYRATWYLALLRLKQNNINSCKNFLKQIPADAEDFAKAQELLKLL